MDLIPEQHPVWTFHPQTFWVQEQGDEDEPSSEIEPIVNQFTCTANALYRKFETNIPRNETARPRSQFLHSCICARFIYSHDRSANSIQQNWQRWMRSSREWMRSSREIRASDCQCQSRNGPGFDRSILWHSGIWGEADEAVLNKVHNKRIKKIHLLKLADWSWEYINRSQIHECRKWVRGHTVSFLGIFVSNFRCIVRTDCVKGNMYKHRKKWECCDRLPSQRMSVLRVIPTCTTEGVGAIQCMYCIPSLRWAQQRPNSWMKSRPKS
jgi:hypothetical protein